jgi:hypothetical protein
VGHLRVHVGTPLTISVSKRRHLLQRVVNLYVVRSPSVAPMIPGVVIVMGVSEAGSLTAATVMGTEVGADATLSGGPGSGMHECGSRVEREREREVCKRKKTSSLLL